MPSGGTVTPAGRGATWEDVITGLLQQAERATDRGERAARLKHAAQIYETQLGDRAKAFAVLQAAFATDLSDVQSAEGLERLAEQLGAGPSLILAFRPLVLDATPARTRAALLAWLGRWLARFTDDFERSEEYLVEALRVDPTCQLAAQTLRVLASQAGACEDLADTPPPSVRAPATARGPISLPALEPLGGPTAGQRARPAPRARPPQPDGRPRAQPAGTSEIEQLAQPADLERRLEALVAAGRWSEAVEALKTLASSADRPMRGKYLATAGKILHHKMGQDQAAVQLFEQSLDAHPAELRVFERLYQILAGRTAWRQAETCVGRMIQRVEAAHIENKVQTLEALWRRLGDVYRLGLQDLGAAAKAYQMCARLAPHSQWYPKMLADIARAANSARGRMS
jgi:tetratricopeptide (TPR) repeat protein